MEAYKLHPLALVNISDHYIRFKAQLPPEEEPPRVLGCLLGFQEGNRDLEICNSFELIWTPEEGTGRVIVDAEYLAGQKVRYKTVYPKMEVVGWYSTGQAVDHEHDLAIHKAICDASEAPVYLLFDPFRVGASEGAGKLRGAKLPIDIVEAVVHVGADGSPHASFRPAKYAIETEAETRSVRLPRLLPTSLPEVSNCTGALNFARSLQPDYRSGNPMVSFGRQNPEHTRLLI